MFHVLIYQPLYNILVFFYSLIPDFGVAIILLTLLVRFALIPIYKKQIASQKKMQEIQPLLKELNQKYKNDKERQTKEIMELYKKHNANPFSGCLPVIVQAFFLFGIFGVLRSIAGGSGAVNAADLYAFMPNPETINTMFLGLIDLARANTLSFGVSFFSDLGSAISSNPGHVLLALGAAATQFYQTKMLMPAQPEKKDDGEPDMNQIMSKQMLVIGPLLTLVIGIQFPAGLALFWVSSTIFMIIQQRQMEKK